MSDCNNDINVLEKPNLLFNLANGEAPLYHFKVNDNEYNMGYWLADEIYPALSCFVKTIPQPLMTKHQNFAMHQEEAIKDVERAFCVLQACWQSEAQLACETQLISLT